VFVNKSNSIQLKVPITHYRGTAEETILLDTGATENFIDQTTVDKLRLGTKMLRLQRALIVRLVLRVNWWRVLEGVEESLALLETT